MQILSEVADILGALLIDRCPEDVTFQRMVAVYRDVTGLLGCQAEYERLLAGLLAGRRVTAPPPADDPQAI